MASRARSSNVSTEMSSLATPMIGQSSMSRRSSRYRARNVILRARSPVIPKITSRFEALPSPSAKTAPPESRLIGSGDQYPRRLIPTLDNAFCPDKLSASRVKTQ